MIYTKYFFSRRHGGTEGKFTQKVSRRGAENAEGGICYPLMVFPNKSRRSLRLCERKFEILETHKITSLCLRASVRKNDTRESPVREKWRCA